MTENIVRFTKEDRSSFSYWFAHWCAYNMTALNLKCWKPRYLLHDIEKPWLKLFMPYDKVQKFHREHNKHHMVYYLLHKKWNAIDAVIDWECSRFTKQSSPRNAADQYELEFQELEEFILKYKLSNTTTRYIAATNPDTLQEIAVRVKNMYIDIHLVLCELNIKHNYNDSYLNEYFEKHI